MNLSAGCSIPWKDTNEHFRDTRRPVTRIR